jgi:hypothetical protein
VLLVGVSKIEVKISHRGLPGLANGFNILNDRGTGGRRQLVLKGMVNEYTNQRTLFPEPAMKYKEAVS